MATLAVFASLASLVYFLIHTNIRSPSILDPHRCNWIEIASKNVVIFLAITIQITRIDDHRSLCNETDNNAEMQVSRHSKFVKKMSL